MKNLSLIFNAILAIAVVVLFVLVLGNKSNTVAKQSVAGKDIVTNNLRHLANEKLITHF